MVKKHAVLFVNGVLPDLERVRELATRADDLIAVDGGLRHVNGLGLQPHLLIGDLDSVKPQEVDAVIAHGGLVERYPIEKDETDLELALRRAVEMGAARITVVAALGGRLDQTIANIHLLALPFLEKTAVSLDDGQEQVCIIRSLEKISGKIGDRVSLLPLTPAVRGVSTAGLRYPLVDEELFFYSSRGVSNELVSDQAEVKITDGMLLCIHSRMEVVK